MASFTPIIVMMLFNIIPSLTHEVHELSGSWDYLSQESWKDSFPSCGGQRQSPIDFEDACFSSSVTRVNTSLTLVLDNYYLKLPFNKMTMKNNGHTAKMSLGGTNEKNNWSPKIRGTALNNHIYQFNELHFHWDQNDTSGSEHSIHGSRQALEMHLVHWNLKYTSMEEAAKHEDGLAVVAILFAANVEENPLLFPIIDHLDDIIPYDSVVKIEEPFTLRSLLPSSYRTFYRYEGSLTTPPCSQVVTWIVVTQVQKIGYAQLNEFTRLDNRENTLVGNTNRRLQSLNGRKVEVSSDAHCFRNDRKRKTYHEGSQSVVGTTLPPNNERLENTTVVPIPVDPSVSKSFWQLIASYFQVPLAFTNVLTQKGETPGYFVSNESIGSSLS